MEELKNLSFEELLSRANNFYDAFVKLRSFGVFQTEARREASFGLNHESSEEEINLILQTLSASERKVLLEFNRSYQENFLEKKVLAKDSYLNLLDLVCITEEIGEFKNDGGKVRFVRRVIE
jgi:hypothetical protein